MSVQKVTGKALSNRKQAIVLRCLVGNPLARRRIYETPEVGYHGLIRSFHSSRPAPSASLSTQRSQ